MIARLFAIGCTGAMLSMFSCSGGGLKCTPGASSACTGPAACSGGQICSSDGMSFGTCNCGGNGGGSVGGGSATGGSAGGGSAGGGSAGGGSAGGGSVTATCDPFAQTGCGPGERCTWLFNIDGGVGSVGCAMPGEIDAGAPCKPAFSAGYRYDDCKGATYCEENASICTALCAPGLGGTCPGGFVCSEFGNVFNAADGGFSAGVCSPTCNPMTQQRDFDHAAACGSPAPLSPTFGCYGAPGAPFLCENAGPAANGLNHDVTAQPYTNACAPGFGLASGGTGTGTLICLPFCTPGPTSSSSSANAGGLVGSGHTCGDRGANGTFECRYWQYFEQSGGFIDSYGNTVGQCFDYTQYTYGGAATMDPSCTTLSSTARTFDAGLLTDTQYWGCEPHP